MMVNQVCVVIRYAYSAWDDDYPSKIMGYLNLNKASASRYVDALNKRKVGHQYYFEVVDEIVPMKGIVVGKRGVMCFD